MMYIAFEGVVGSGKTTQSRRLVKYLQEKYPDREVVWTREPGGSEIADEIRRVVQGTIFDEEMDPVCEQYLYAASRAQTLRRVVKPVLDRGGIVVADRSVFTSFAFQGFGRGLGYETVLAINKVAVGEVWPDLVVFINVELETALNRSNDKIEDKFELMGKDFFERVQEGYKYAGTIYKEFVEVDGNGSGEEVWGRVQRVVQRRLRDHEKGVIAR